MADAELSPYEAQRKQNMAANAAMLTQLGLNDKLIQKHSSRTGVKRARSEPREATREPSRRSRQLPVPTYTPGQHESMAESQRQEEIDDGQRLPDGSWSGERFGEVEGVEVGTVFGRGDYQRLGRQEMMLSGFFRPHVQPEWVCPGGGCYAVILNNDNGASTDEGDVIRYAGSGGRMRGQNRTAPQSFHQDWKNATNAALRHNCETGKLVRVVRGPKLPGEHGTLSTGGGYRYDGLYQVEQAELVRLPGSKLLTAMFTLVRVWSKSNPR